jgi:hypothetical protein
MTIEEFLLARITDAMQSARYHIQADSLRNQMLRILETHKLIVDWHQNWPVLLQEEPKLERGVSTVDEITYTMSQKLEWLTQEEYRKRFGDEPPTAPLLRQMAAKYSWHPDYNTEWAI